MPSNKTPSDNYIRQLEKMQRNFGIATVEYARIQAELEDITDGHWDGPRTDITQSIG